MSPVSRDSSGGRAYLGLQAQARSSGRPTDELIQLYALEGFLARLIVSPLRDRFVLKGGVQIDPDELTRQIVASVREHVGPVAAFKEVVVVPGLPKTRSGKILRRTMRGIADGRPEQVPSTIEDASVLEVLTPLLRRHSGQAVQL